MSKRLKDYAVRWNEQEHHHRKNGFTPNKDKYVLPPGVVRLGDESASLIHSSINCENKNSNTVLHT